MNLDTLLAAMAEHQASDLHLQVGSPPMVRLNGKLVALQLDPLTDESLTQLVEPILDDGQKERFEEDRAVDLSYAVEGLARFRVAVFHEKSHPAATIRRITSDVPTVESLNLPPVVEEIALIERGLVLVTGTTGSGKSSTLAAMMNYLNHNRSNRIITIEDPIEFVHEPKKSLVAQREVGPDASSFLASLREALRQDPDVILIGELRDHTTMATALQAADTGHAVYSTVHTTTAAQTVQRLIALFPPAERDLLLVQLATNLEAVISQRLARTVDGKGRVPVVEVLRSNSAVRKFIHEGRAADLNEIIEHRENGMQTFDQHLLELYTAKTISGTEALRLASNPEAVSMGMRSARFKMV
ncbi:type IV pilus twitching motility protein PilT [Algisphaera agarilytica]|uniref:Twitching motility protein PilT n=1 Tax=Algisphaera agarilytica TaxID=1385975 RepID=A0A7X0H4Y2_9BACT|nr:PilT/PilU family type 4a pilus ATPase [Algisphaera agarilytica]MBB6429356.1 twitching motility protein PilT [Algisphaera agarilytica]